MGTKQFDNYADLITFTRASGATLLDSDGLLKRAGHNLLTYSEEFDNAAWANKVNVTVTSNQTTAPDGTTTAEKAAIVSTTDGIYSNQDVTVLSAGYYTFSIYAKNNTAGYIVVRIGDQDNNVDRYLILVDLSDGSVVDTATSRSPSNVSNNVTSIGNGWYKISVTAELDGTTLRVVYAPYANSTVSHTNGTPNNAGGSVGDSIYIWGAHLYRSDMPMVPNRNSGWTAETTYYPTTSAAYEAPRIEYDADGNRLGLLVEEQRTNLLQRSEEFDDAYWTKDNSTVTANTIVAPDGTLTGDKLAENTDTDSHSVIKENLIAAGTTYTASIFAKKAERNYLVITGYGGSAVNLSAEFDLNNGVVSKAETGATGVIQFVGNGWYRCSMTFNLSSTPATDRIIFAVSDGGNFNDAYGRSYTGDGTSGIYVWGAQVEAGAFPTSYIPTSGSTATRAADFARITGADFNKWFNPDEGSLVVNGISASGIASNSQSFYTIHNNSNSNLITFGRNPSNNPSLYIQKDGLAQAVIISTQSLSDNQEIKVASAYAFNNSASSVDGETAQTDSSCVIPSVLTLSFGDRNDGLRTLNGHIKSIKYYPRRLTNAQLQELTQ
jgi:hypothetical protein